MTNEDRLRELLLTWQTRRDRGEPITPEELCCASPELLDEFRRRIQHMPTSQVPPAKASPPTTLPHETTPVEIAPTPTFHESGYEILSELGRGGMGVVYRARQTALKRVVALKTFLPGEAIGPQELERFRFEAEAVARLQHPNIVQIFEIGEHSGKPFLALELIEGGSLEDHVGKPWKPSEAANFIETLARAMHYAHTRSVVHRDLKPGNVLLGKLAGASPALQTAIGVPKIADFGLARCLVGGPRLTQAGMVVGTPAYMAPEQASGLSDAIGPATDIFALGVILYELLTGQLPFDGASVYDTLRAVVEEAPKPPGLVQPGIPLDLESICLKCLEKDPTNRYASAEELAEALRCFQAGQPISETPRTPADPSRHGLRRHAVQILLGAALIGAVFFLVFVVAKRPPAPPPPPPPLPGTLEVYDAAMVQRQAAALRGDYFALLNEARRPDGWVAVKLANKADAVQEHEVWAHSQSVAAVFEMPEPNLDELKPWLPSLDKPFSASQAIEKDGVKFGWLSFPRADFSIAPPALQTALALTAALNRPELLKGAARTRRLDELRYAQEVLRIYRPKEFSGGWNVFPNQNEGTPSSEATTAIALHLLLDMKRGRLPWEGSEERRDELLAATVRWVDGQYDAAAHPPGWHEPNRNDPVGDTLTLKLYALRLQADREAGFDVPSSMLEKIPARLKRCANRPFDFNPKPVWVAYPFRGPSGSEMSRQQTMVVSWYGWAVYASAQWLKYAEQRSLPAEQAAPAQQALQHLVVTIGADVLKFHGPDSTFYAADNLQGLSQVPMLEKTR